MPKFFPFEGYPLIGILVEALGIKSPFSRLKLEELLYSDGSSLLVGQGIAIDISAGSWECSGGK